MSSSNYSSVDSRPEGVQSEFDSEEMNEIIIKELKEKISLQDQQISQLEDRNKTLDEALQESKKSCKISCREIGESWGRIVDRLNAQIAKSNREATILKKKNDRLWQEMQELSWKNKNSSSFPKDLLNLCAQLQSDAQFEKVLEDDLFEKELARRIVCKICLAEVERLRCSQCFKGLCDDCYQNVPECIMTERKACPYCRSEHDFEVIRMSRI